MLLRVYVRVSSIIIEPAMCFAFLHPLDCYCSSMRRESRDYELCKRRLCPPRHVTLDWARMDHFAPRYIALHYFLLYANEDDDHDDDGWYSIGRPYAT